MTMRVLRPLVVVRLSGGLGNQMFQYATARSVAVACNGDVCFDLGWFASSGGASVGARRYELWRFPVAVAGALHLAPRRIASIERGRSLRVGCRRLRLTFFRQEEMDIRADRRVLDLIECPEALESDGVYLDGYWQSPRYFEHMREILRGEDLRLTGELAAGYGRTARAIRETESVALHVRRGDYASDPRTNAVHGLLPHEYYHRALAFIGRRLQEPHVFVFSNDAAWCRDRLSFDMRVTYVTGGDAYSELRLMTMCDAHVIANSSFSWWGAWLAPGQDRLVVAPRAWFRDPTVDTRDVVPSAWKRV